MELVCIGAIISGHDFLENTAHQPQAFTRFIIGQCLVLGTAQAVFSGKARPSAHVAAQTIASIFATCFTPDIPACWSTSIWVSN